MELHEYLFEEKVKNPKYSCAMFAKLLGIERQRLSRILYYREMISPHQAEKIEKATNGKVKKFELLEKCMKYAKKKKKKDE